MIAKAPGDQSRAPSGEEGDKGQEKLSGGYPETKRIDGSVVREGIEQNTEQVEYPAPSGMFR